MYPTSINSVTVSAGGSNDASGATLVNISGGGGSGALPLSTVSGGAVTAIKMASVGFNYYSQPVVFTSGIVNTSSLVCGSGYVLDKT